jgi:hypothetical protein
LWRFFCAVAANGMLKIYGGVDYDIRGGLVRPLNLPPTTRACARRTPPPSSATLA